MEDFEKLGVFYLGKRCDPADLSVQSELLLYDSKDLTTHAVCVGMTGSGKTGLCISLLEEAAIDGIPAIAIDPKGDLGNLLLTFPELQPANFQPWIDTSAAARAGQTAEQYAADTAQRWSNGLAEWGQDGARVQRMRDAVDLSIYTPGSSAGRPLAVLRAFTAPVGEPPDTDAWRDRINGAVSSLLALLNIDADPLRSREHILLANILDHSWRAGKDLPLAALIHSIQSPPMTQVGVMDLESFFPAKERFELSLSLNNMLASPGFAVWTAGEPLDVARLLHTAAGKPRLSIISIAHLSDPERMFFVTLLLNEVVAWMRRQSGTSSLRAILYMDEVFGFFPPTANPPSKIPMLTLMKQARAYGLGVVLATQNPVDLDYKGLSNAGTWFLGRLQTERDKLRVLDGLEGANASAGVAFDRQRMEAVLSGLGNRTFLMNNVYEDAPVVFQTRWALSYLRGPMTLEQIRQLNTAGPALATTPPTSGAEQQHATPTMFAASATSSGTRPALPPGIPEFFLPPRRLATAGQKLVYRPAILGEARVHFIQAKTQIDHSMDVRHFAPLAADIAVTGIWETAEPWDETPDLEPDPVEGAGFDQLPAGIAQHKKFSSLATALKDHLYRNQKLTLWKSALSKTASLPGESEAEFRVRLAQHLREERDQMVEKLRAKYAPKLAALQERLRLAEQRVEREKSQANQHTIQAAVSFGSSLLGALFGRKLASSTNVTRAAGSIRAAGRAAQQRADIGEAQETTTAIEQQRLALEEAFQQEAARIEQLTSADGLQLESFQVQPKKADVEVIRVALVWTPWLEDGNGTAQAAY